MDCTAKDVPIAVRRVPTEDDFLSLAELKALTPAMVIERCRALKPLIAAHAREGELQRRPVDDVWHAVSKTGVFYMLQPKRFNGLEATFEELMDAVLALSEADAALGWLVAFATMNPRTTAMFLPEVQEELMGGNRYTVLTTFISPIGTARKVEGGYRVSGRYNWGTTVLHASWVTAAANLETENGPLLSTYMMPIEDVEILDVWDAQGMIATGTNDILVKDVFVPEHRAVMASVMTAEGQKYSAKLYDYPLLLGPPMVALSLCCAIPALGAAKHALETWRLRLLDGHMKRTAGTREIDKNSAQMRLARAATLINTAEMMIRHSGRETYALVGTPTEKLGPLMAPLHAEMTQAAHFCVEAIMMIIAATGTSVHYMDNPIQRCLRDAIVATSHIMLDIDVNMENYGRSLLGLPPAGTAERTAAAAANRGNVGAGA